MATTEELAQLIWDFNNNQAPVTKSDCILVLGSNDLRVAQRGAELFLQGYAPLIIFAGNEGRLTQGVFDKPEAEMFADEALNMGVPKEAILIENKSTNTGENIRFTKTLLQEKGLLPLSFIVVTTPYLQVRALATLKKHMPEVAATVTAPTIALESYTTQEIPRHDIIDTMVGEIQRLQTYPAKGFCVPVELPEEILHAYTELIAQGYTKRLVEPL
ncbi:MAG: YdcF family protein [Candidatus Andersenbacteria bacterium]|nr:YdcF family protein [Candidatus Andersenbacteria bacterium]